MTLAISRMTLSIFVNDAADSVNDAMNDARNVAGAAPVHDAAVFIAICSKSGQRHSQRHSQNNQRHSQNRKRHSQKTIVFEMPPTRL